MQKQTAPEKLRLYWSEDVSIRFKKSDLSWKKWIEGLKKEDEGKIPHFEHVLPTTLILRMMVSSKVSEDPELLSQCIEKAFNNWITVCWITREENRRLQPKGSKECQNLKSCMPKTFGNLSCICYSEEQLFSRYGNVFSDGNPRVSKCSKIPEDMLMNIVGQGAKVHPLN